MPMVGLSRAISAASMSSRRAGLIRSPAELFFVPGRFSIPRARQHDIQALLMAPELVLDPFEAKCVDELPKLGIGAGLEDRETDILCPVARRAGQLPLDGHGLSGHVPRLVHGFGRLDELVKLL